MQHVPFALSIMLLLGGCAVVEMPTADVRHPDWVEDRLNNAGDGRQAPPVVPVTSLADGEGEAMDRAARQLLAEKAAMEAAAAHQVEANQRGSAEEFVTDGQARTEPPQP
ncbi:hypothetical protein [Maricaulis sp.]|uniref:hypothetical protein n=1 Tax=Maricaulis sp. TaxID=1486257 RepID=UPI002B27607B|nr:hypothetical protein [Maricaulis sp.]